MIKHTPPTESPLGKSVAYTGKYDASLLFAIPRQIKRDELSLSSSSLPFFGVDIWNAYEVSWLNQNGKPQVAIATITVPASSPNITESKSCKLYFNSFNQTPFASPSAVQETIQRDISQCVDQDVTVTLTLPEAFNQLTMGQLEGTLLDRLDISVDNYTPTPTILHADHTLTPVSEVLVSHLLKSNCLVTGQPDWASVQISYHGAPINQECLLRYLISFRDHHEFHEQCVERIFMDILKYCQPQKLAVYARYTRRGGIDINPWRSNYSTKQAPSNLRNARQ